MTFGVRQNKDSWPPVAGRNFVALLVALAFALQSFFTQTHLHRITVPFGDTGIVKIIGSDPAGGKAPGDGSPIDCPYCQAVAHSGVFFMPVAPLLDLPGAQAESAPFPASAQTVKKAVALNQRSRAPPAL